MSEAIKDGTGTGYLAKVGVNNRLYVDAVVSEEVAEANRDGRAFNINTGEITLTNDTDTPVLYIENTGVGDMHISSLIFGFGTSTGGTATEMNTITIVRNPTTGTVISGATACDMISNRNFGSNTTFAGNAYKGATGNTLTDGTDHIIIYQSDFGRTAVPVDERLPQGATLGIKVAPMSGNTSLTMYAAVVAHQEEAQ